MLNGTIKAAILAAGLAAALAVPALAHHGWAWTENETFELRGVITDIYIGNPHVTLDVEADGVVWRVELAPLIRSTNAGFVEGVAEVGDEVIAIGNRSNYPNETRMKAVRIIIDGTNYDVYPSRVPNI